MKATKNQKNFSASFFAAAGGGNPSSRTLRVHYGAGARAGKNSWWTLTLQPLSPAPEQVRYGTSLFARPTCPAEARGPAFGGINSAPSEAGNANFTTWLPGLVSYVFDFGLPSYIFFMRKLPKVACYSVALAKDSCGTWIRTKINGFKGHCPTIRRSRNKIYLNL